MIISLSLLLASKPNYLLEKSPLSSDSFKVHFYLKQSLIVIIVDFFPNCLFFT